MPPSVPPSRSELRERLSQFIVGLAIRRQAQLSIDDRFQQILERLLRGIAISEQKSIGDFTLLSSKTHAGYLEGSVNNSKVFVPWHLIEIFPSVSVLSEMEILSRQVRLGTEGAICLSGSSVFRGALSVIGDADFCEYLFDQPHHIPSLIEKLIGRLKEASLARIYLPSNSRESYLPPWNGRCPANVVALCGSATSPAKTPILMFEYLASDSALGILPVTNRVLPVDEKEPAADHGQETFVFQEAVLCQTVSPPRALVVPIGWQIM